MNRILSKRIPSKTIVALGLSLLLGAGLTACGQKGPLYIPQEAPAEQKQNSQ